MASRQLLCSACGKRPLIAEDPGSHTTFVWGRSKLQRPPDDIVVTVGGIERERIPVTEMACDACSAVIRQGDRACAWTFWTDQMSKPDWEGDYLDDITDFQRHDW